MLFSIFGCKRQARIEADTLYQKIVRIFKTTCRIKKIRALYYIKIQNRVLGNIFEAF